MKVLRLMFKNLNSLAGVWDIDFTHPAYLSNGIFAITGPTGAGKTTILDAICLALYGQTPRLNRITQSENEIMSRQTGECFAEVEFETAKGRFRCHWSQHRSRKQADGLLQSPRHEIADAETGMILESKLRAVADKVEDVTGMDFDRFTRSMLLAQGGFAAFLQARPDERAPILEQITGTSIYSRISIKVHERTSDERKRLGELRAELDGIQLLLPAEAETLFLEKSELQRLECALTGDLRIIREAQAWRERIVALESELLQLDQDRLAFEMRKAAAAPDLDRLAQAGRALTLGGDHAHILLMRMQQKSEQDELATAAERLPLLQLNWQAAFDTLELDETGLTRARGEQAEEGEMIRKARELDLKLGEANRQLQGLMDDMEKTERQNSDYRLAIAACDLHLNEAEGELQGIADFLDAHQADAGLAEALTGIEQRLNSLKVLDSQWRDTLAKLGRHAPLIESATHALNQAETVWQGGEQAATVAEQRLKMIHTAREAVLKGRDLSAWRVEAEALATRQNRLGAIQETLARIEVAKPEVAELKLRLEGLEQKRQALVQQVETLAGESELREQVARQLQDNVILLNRVRSLEDDRKQLVDGAPCPLCGASEHPYATGNIPQPDEAQSGLELAFNEAKRVREQLSQLKLEEAGVVKDLHRAGQDLYELQKGLQRDDSFCANAFMELGVSVDAKGWSVAIRRESDLCQGELFNCRTLIQTAEEKEQEERSAQAALNRLKDKLAGDDKVRLAARLGLESALSEQKRLELESVILRAELDRSHAGIESAVAVYGCSGILSGKADELLASLTARRSEYVERLQARERAEKRRADSAAERDKQRAILAESEKSILDSLQQLRVRTEQRESLVEQRRELYGERNPDKEEKRLADALRQASERREASLQEQNRLHAELAGLNRQVERLTLSVSRRGEELSKREAALGLRFNECGFSDESAFLQACLPQELFEELTQWGDSLKKDEIALQVRYQDRREALRVETSSNLTDKPLDLIREENALFTTQLTELQKRLGAIDHTLQQHAEQLECQKERLQALEIQRQECDRWERLHSLIGSGDGKKFRNFAQGLTFELMIAHANRRLQNMSDRYILVRDNFEPLELNVIDNYQAGEIRSTKNLSGGESFIASLALSLGLSSMASREVAVDSLFLDEGFGTLDEDALETALETLSGLQHDGKLIGIISHVPALKERIGTRIQVEVGSGGRSSLSGPGCRRITYSA